MKRLFKRNIMLLHILILSILITLFLPDISIVKANEIKLNRTKTSLTLGKTASLKLKGTKSYIYWTSEDATIASVTNTGLVTAKKEGNTKITAFVEGKKYTCLINVKKPTGSRTNPYSAYHRHTINFKEYSFSKSKRISIKLLQIVVGDAANAIIHNENQYNKKSTDKLHWILYQFHLSYIKGPEEALSAADVFRNYKCFYNTKGTAKISVHEFACYSKIRSGKDIYDVNLYPGGKSDVWIGILVDKSVHYPLLSIPIGLDKLVWFTTNPVTK